MKCLGIISTVILLVFGAVLVTLSFVAPPLISTKINDGLQQNLQLKKGSNTYKLWKDNTKPSSVPQYLKIRLWNITNPEEVLQGTAKPNVVEVGPYTYRKNMKRFAEKYSDDKNSVQFRTWTYYTFQRNMSSGDPKDDMVTTANLAYAGLKHQLGDEWYFNMVADVLASSQKNKPIITKSAQDHIWGYENEMLQFVQQKLKPDVKTLIQIQPNQTSFEDSMAQRKTDTIHTGRDDVKKALQFIQFQETNSTGKWASAEANHVTGTDGSQFHINLDDGSVIYPWVDDAFRTMTLKVQGHVTIQGVELLRFSIAPVVFKNSTEHPDNAAYYQFGPSGVGNLTSIFQAPVFFSQPHFLNAPYYAEGVVGMTPDPEKHATFLDVQPTTGLTMSVAKRSQISVRVTPSILRYPNMKTSYIPVVWMELVSQLTQSSAAEFQVGNSQIVDAQAISKTIVWVGRVLGGVCIAIALVLIAILSRKAIQQKRAGYKPI